MRKSISILFLIGLVAWGSLSAFKGVTTDTASSSVKWHNLEEAQELQKKKKKKIMIDIYTDWCGWCKVMDKKTFSQESVSKVLNDKFYAVKLNAESPNNLIFNGKVYKPNAKGVNEIVPMWLGTRYGYPTTVYLDEDLKLIGKVEGFHEAKDYLVILDYFEKEIYGSGKSVDDYLSEQKKKN